MTLILPKRRAGGFWSGSLRLPRLGRFHFGYERDGADFMPGGITMGTKLLADVFDAQGRLIEHRDLGSGKVTNIGVNLMSLDYTLAIAPVLKQMNFHAIGTGTTAEAASDYYLQTPIAAASLTGSTNGYMTGTQSQPFSTGPNIYQSVATFTANGTLAVTEWGIFNSNAAPFTGRTATATSATSLTDSGAAFTTTGNGLMGWAVEANASAINTPTTTVWGLVTSNTATALTIPGWLTLANAGAATPAGTAAYVVYPAMWDHKTFAAINLAATNTLQITYQLTIQSGG